MHGLVYTPPGLVHRCLAIFLLACPGVGLPSLRAQDCAPVAAGLAGWWPAENNAKDSGGPNHGVLQGNATYGAGKVGVSFAFDGNGDGVFIGNPAAFQAQSFTIEAWVRRTSATQATLDVPANGVIFGYGWNGYAFAMTDDGRLLLSKVGVDAVYSTSTIRDTNWHHVAVTKAAASVTFFVDGAAEPAQQYTAGFVFASNAMIGALLADGVRGSFLGLIDELSVYGRALTTGELQALVAADSSGKCPPPSVALSPRTGVFADSLVVTLSPNTTNGVIRYTVDGSLPASNSILYEGPITLVNTTTLAAQLFDVNIPISEVSIETYVRSGARQVCTTTNGLVSWWPGELSPLDIQTANDGKLRNAATYAPGKSGQAFRFDGNNAAVVVGNSAALQLQTFTVEAWIKRDRADIATLASGGTGVLFGYGGDGYGFGIQNDGRLFLTRVAVSAVFSTLAVRDTNWHHVAVAKSGNSVVFHVDGKADSPISYDPGFVFTSNAAIGAAGESGSGFLGRIDELSVFGRGLNASEVAALYNATAYGRCSPESITISPAGSRFTNSVTLTLGTSAPNGVIRYTLDGSAPSPASTAYAQPITISNTVVLTAQVFEGELAVSPAAREVYIATGCVSMPAGLVSWWQGEANPVDAMGRNDGTPKDNAAFVEGKVGQAFRFDGNGDALEVGEAPAVQAQSFTIEAWVRRERNDLATLSGSGNGVIFGYGWGGYAFGLFNDGRLLLTKVGSSHVASTIAITNANWHHVAVVKSGSTVTFYQDGIPDFPATYDPGFQFNTPAAIGALGGDFSSSFLGSIDELSIYDRALGVLELLALFGSDVDGKCTGFAPIIVAQPKSQIVAVGSSVTFDVKAGSASPLSYRWEVDGRWIEGATNETLVIPDVQPEAAGSYRVTLSNPSGSVTSQPATLVVDRPPVITRQPKSLTVHVGSSASFSVQAAGLPPLTYQWLFNNDPIPGATGPVVILGNAEFTHSGGYSVRVTNPVGSSLSEVAVLAVGSGRLSLTVDAGGVHLGAVGEVSANYSIEVSSDLVNWSPLATVVNASAAWQFDDPTAPGVSHRFYRLRKN